MTGSRGPSRKTNFTGPRVEQVQLDESRIPLRLLLAVLALLLGAATLTWSITGYLGRNAGWNEISATDAETSCALEYTFRYNLGQGELSPTQENKALSQLYTQATDRMSLLLNPCQEMEGEANLCSLNRHPNETLTVDASLYRSLRLLTENSTLLYMGPVWEVYRSMFSAADSTQALTFDPYTDPETAQYVSRIMEYIHDGAVELRFMGDNTLQLRVSEDYLAYAEQMEVEYFLDPGILSDALILDETARQLQDAGYTEGVLSTVSGFTRTLSPDVEVTVNLYERNQNEISWKDTCTLQDVTSVVILRSFPLQQSEYWYADLGDGEIRTAYLSQADGLCRTAEDFLPAASADYGCTELALLLWPVYTARSADRAAFDALESLGIHVLP